MKQLHYLGGMIISVFVSIHLFNHFLSIQSIELHLSTMEKLRLIYRNPIIESLLLLIILSQVISGVKLFISKRRIATSFFDHLQLYSGLYLAFFFVIHIGAVVMGRYVLDLDTNFYFGAAGLNLFPVNLFFIPYYSLAIVSFFGHIASIHHARMKGSILELSVKKQSLGILIIGLVLSIMIIYGLTDGFYGIEIPEQYEKIFEL